jgi:hypothetical protein
MCKMGSHHPFEHYKHKLWPKKRSRVELPIWLLTTKSCKSPWFHCPQVVCNIPLISSWQGLQICFKPHLNKRSAHKIMGLQSCRNLSLGNLGTPTWESPNIWSQWHLGVGLVAMHKEYYKREGGGFPQVRAVVSIVTACLLVACQCTKSVPTMH